MSYVATLTILNGIKTKLEALLYDGGPDLLFEQIALYDVIDLERAFEDLTFYKKRVCLIVPAEDQYENSRDGMMLTSQRTSRVMVLMADRDDRMGQEAVFGGTNNPGTIAMKDQVIEAIAGESLDTIGVVLQPLGGEDFEIGLEESDSPARKGWVQLFETTAGIKKVALPRQ